MVGRRGKEVDNQTISDVCIIIYSSVWLSVYVFVFVFVFVCLNMFVCLCVPCLDLYFYIRCVCMHALMRVFVSVYKCVRVGGRGRGDSWVF